MGAAIPMASNANTDSNDVTILAPSGDLEEFAAFLDLESRKLDAAFSPARIGALDALSQALLRHPELRRDAAAVALGFWLRRANLASLEQDFRRGRTNAVIVPAGLVFHVAPANVDTMFVYSWALAFLTGNTNIVRLTTQLSPLMEHLLACIRQVGAARRGTLEGNWFVTYPHESTATALISAKCDLRIIWGGDETVARLRNVPLNPHAAERAFASKRSLSVIDAVNYLALSATERSKVAEGMALDIAPFGQMACSSPHVVYWLGTLDAVRVCKERFELDLDRALGAKGTEPEFAAAVRRLNFAFDAAASGRVAQINHRAYTTNLLSSPSAEPDQLPHCGVGLLSHVACGRMEDIVAYLKSDHQTITYAGLSDDQRQHLAEAAGIAGVDRVVPFGRALAFSPQWDGYDLWSDLTRIVVVE